jgi:hypothetical protein
MLDAIAMTRFPGDASFILRIAVLGAGVVGAVEGWKWLVYTLYRIFG